MRWRTVHWTAVVSAAAIVAVAAAGRAAATTQVALTMEELIYLADRIVVGTVMDAEARFAEGGRFIVTDVEVQVDEVLKGPEVAGALTVWQLGGEVDGVGMRVEGTAELDPGERVLLFLEEGRHGLGILGWAQGKLCIETDAATGRELAVRGAARAVRTRTPDPAWIFRFDELRDAVIADVRAGHVPAYREIPGLPPHKRRAFRAHWGLPDEGVGP